MFFFSCFGVYLPTETGMQNVFVVKNQLGSLGSDLCEKWNFSRWGVLPLFLSLDHLHASRGSETCFFCLPVGKGPA